jgi:hypothetical protein
MNSETGQIYEGDEQIEAARQRGEKLIELSPRILKEVSAQPRVTNGDPRNRAQRRAARFGGARGRPWERL